MITDKKKMVLYLGCYHKKNLKYVEFALGLSYRQMLKKQENNC